MVRFKRETGKEINEIDFNSITELCTYLWCCICAASNREGKEFKLSFIDFADNTSPEDMREWTKAIQAKEGEGDTEEDAEKKSPSA